MKRIMTAALFALVALALTASPARAHQRPTTEVFIIENDVQEVPSPCSGIDITFTQNGSFKITTYYDDQGNVVKEILTNYNSRYTETAKANEKTLTTNFPAVYITYYPSGETVQAGLRASYTVPGAGKVLLDAGRIVFDGETVVFEAGPHDTVDGGSLDAFCGYFAA